MICFCITKHNSVYIRSPAKKDGAYGVHVTGATSRIGLYGKIVRKREIINCKVINIKKHRLMFSYGNEAEILANQKHLIKISYSGNLSDSIIAFGINSDFR